MSYDSDQMLEEHRAQWDGFMKLTIAATVAVVVTLIMLALFLV
ncbi:MAG: aa3-type cytochrome c oxidase subunit IV [Alphaproteobacteria bacterium]|jgi:hypothetical protein|nr:aa3-type cytochrome c oxidase subunit IV [Alphaproteobacteria bacterium]MDP6515305.1 aa3-type cytochrome c oxidase subunit IV [Alphaproteobacteria bacterium]|tara:strand:- start:256 stop:384 length:129 start_codon:yes stop_codon:yes gene_type:complete